MGVIRRLQKGTVVKTNTLQGRGEVVIAILTKPEFKATPREQFVGLYRWVRTEVALARLQKAKANLRKETKQLDLVLDPILFRAQLDQYL